MAIVPVKCPSCGANLRIDETRQSAFCEYCGSPFIVQEAQNNFMVKGEIRIEKVGTMNVNSDQTANARIEAGEAFLKLGKKDEATKAFIEACRIKPQDYRGYWGQVKAEILLNQTNLAGIDCNQLSHIAELCKDMVVFANKDEKAKCRIEIAPILSKLNELIINKINRDQASLDSVVHELELQYLEWSELKKKTENISDFWKNNDKQKKAKQKLAIGAGVVALLRLTTSIRYIFETLFAVSMLSIICIEIHSRKIKRLLDIYQRADDYRFTLEQEIAEKQALLSQDKYRKSIIEDIQNLLSD